MGKNPTSKGKIPSPFPYRLKQPQGGIGGKNKRKPAAPMLSLTPKAGRESVKSLSRREEKPLALPPDFAFWGMKSGLSKTFFMATIAPVALVAAHCSSARLIRCVPCRIPPRFLSACCPPVASPTGPRHTSDFDSLKAPPSPEPAVCVPAWRMWSASLNSCVWSRRSALDLLAFT